MLLPVPPTPLPAFCLACAQALADAGLTAESVAYVEVVGGSSRMPAVAGLLAGLFGREPSRTLNAKETVARGCALQCAMLSPTFKVRDFQVLDSFPYGVQFRCGADVAGRALDRLPRAPRPPLLAAKPAGTPPAPRPINPTQLGEGGRAGDERGV